MACSDARYRYIIVPVADVTQEFLHGTTTRRLEEIRWDQDVSYGLFKVPFPIPAKFGKYKEYRFEEICAELKKPNWVITDEEEVGWLAAIVAWLTGG
jgi:hypothetical protein